MEITERLCRQCRKPLRGRIDKKFCDDYCRNAFNNSRLAGEQDELVRHINSVLKRNRKILQNCLPEGEATARLAKAQLLRQGYQLQYHTHSYTNKKGDTYLFCYDYGLLPLEKEMVLVVRNREH